MRNSTTLTTFAWLAKDTFRQARASGILAVLLIVSALSIVVCLSISVNGPSSLAIGDDNPDFIPRHDPDAKDPQKLEQSGVIVADGSLTLLFGEIRVPLARDTRSAIHFVELLLAAGVADTLGLMLALIWTAGFLPGFLDPRSVSVLLAKPAPRWVLILGKYAGVLLFVLVNAAIFVTGTWAAIGLRTGVWDRAYLLAIPLLLLHFSIFFGFSVLLAVLTRNTAVCVFGTLLFWCVAWSMNFGRHAYVASSDMVSESLRSPFLSAMVDLGYWILPKPADLGALLFDSLGAGDHFGKLVDPATLAAHGFSLTLSVASSLAFAAAVLFASVRAFKATDY